MRNYSLIIIAGLLGMVTIACNLSNLAATTPTETSEGSSLIIPSSLPTTETPLQMQNTPLPPTDSQASCLNGTWAINNLSSYVTAAIPPDLASQYKLKYKDTSGSANVTFTPDGHISLRFDKLVFRFSATVSIVTVPLTVEVNGEARGDYSLNGDMLTTSNMDTSGLSASARAMGQDVIEPAKIIGFIPLVKSPYDRASYTCAGDTLQLEFPAYPEDFPPLVFQRVK